MITADGTAVYPWNHGETLTAAALNAAFAQSTGAYVGTGAPGAPAIGTVWYNSGTGLVSIWDGSAWQPTGPATSVGTTTATRNNGSTSIITMRRLRQRERIYR